MDKGKEKNRKSDDDNNSDMMVVFNKYTFLLNTILTFTIKPQGSGSRSHRSN